ncbi:peptidase family C50-domain-containing protein, partial [Schizophyllum fasciatum]
TFSSPDTSTAVTLRREMVEVITHKFPDYDTFDDLQWRAISAEGIAKPVANASPARLFARMSLEDDQGSDEEDSEERTLREYWARVKSRYDAVGTSPDASAISTETFPANWTIVHIAVTEDRRTLFLSRQEGGERGEPLVFCIPLQGRRDTDDDEEYLSFDDALSEMGEIVRLSNESTKTAVNIRNSPEARQNWWKERAALDTRLKELLQSIEFCWLGGFKTILGSRLNLTPEAIDDIRQSIDKVFDENLRLRDKKPK